MKVRLTKGDLEAMLQAKYISSDGWGEERNGKRVY
jgi:hypothetical protein